MYGVVCLGGDGALCLVLIGTASGYLKKTAAVVAAPGSDFCLLEILILHAIAILSFVASLAVKVFSNFSGLSF